MIVAFRNVIIEKTIFSSEYFLNISQFYFSDFSLRTVTNLCDCHIDWFHSWWYLLFTYLTFQVSLKNLLMDPHLNLQKSILIRKNNIHEKVIITTKSEIENKSEFLKSRFGFFISQVCKKKKKDLLWQICLTKLCFFIWLIKMHTVETIVNMRVWKLWASVQNKLSCLIRDCSCCLSC